MTGNIDLMIASSASSQASSAASHIFNKKASSLDIFSING